MKTKIITVISVCLLSLGVMANDLLTKNIEAAAANQMAARSSQQKIDVLYNQHSEALQEFRVTQAEIDQLTVYNRQLNEIIGNQKKQIQSLDLQIHEIELTQQGIMPLMERMLSGLEAFIELDSPFLLTERRERVAKLRVLLLSSDITVSEKYRRILESFQIEVEYGRTIEAYRAKNDNQQMVDFLRLGRVALYYLPLTGQGAKLWVSRENTWQALSRDHDRFIQKGIRIARKQAAPNLIELPLPTIGGEK